MATNTVPIEIVLQDPNNPIVPLSPDPVSPDDPGENTNILVPDTALGTGTTKDGNGTNGIFSGTNATASIASIIVLVLALGAIITLLVRRYQKHKKAQQGQVQSIAKSTTSRKEKLLAATSGTLAVLAATVLVGNLLITSTNAATNNENNISNEDTVLTTPDKIQIIANRYDDVTIVASTKVTSLASTDTTFGYKIFMSMAGEDANLYLDGDNASEYYFTPTENAGLDDNSWGYSLDGKANYTAMPLLDNALMAQQNTSAISDEEFTVYYTMKADKDMPFGVYSGEISYDIEGYSGFPDTLTTMQGMTSEICAKVYTPGKSTTDKVPTATLKDTRDNKYYEVAKLADGKCWMTQNLDLDLKKDGSIVYDSTNTDLPTNTTWIPANTTISFTGTTVDGWQNDNNVPYSADPGNLYYYSSGDTSTDKQYTLLADCKEHHPDCSAKNHTGNYYNWSAAIANNNTEEITTNYTNANTSICPAGWKLPDGPNIQKKDYSEISNLVATYEDILEKPIHEGCNDECSSYSYLTGGLNRIRTAPLWLARSGGIYYGSFYGNGDNGYYWSNTVTNDFNSYQLTFNGGNLSPTGYGGRGGGYSVRCVAR